jgi:hypothetical protein
MSAFNEEQATAISTVTQVAATLSFLGSLGIVATYLLLPRVQRFSYRIVAWLSMSDLFSSLAYFVHAPTPFVTLVPPYDAGCIAGAVMSQIFDLATFIWTVAVSLTVYMVLVRQSSATELRTAEIVFHAVGWGVPVLFASIAGGVGAYGDSGTWCWITSQFQALRLVLFYIPLILCIIAVGVIAYLMHRGVPGSDSIKASQKPLVLRRVNLFFGLFFVLRIFSIINRFQQLAAPPGSPPVFVLSLLHAIFSPIQGFANSLVYGYNRLVQTEYALLCARWWGSDARAGHGEVSTENPMGRSFSKELRGLNALERQRRASAQSAVAIGVWSPGSSPSGVGAAASGEPRSPLSNVFGGHVSARLAGDGGPVSAPPLPGRGGEIELTEIKGSADSS